MFSTLTHTRSLQFLAIRLDTDALASRLEAKTSRDTVFQYFEPFVFEFNHLIAIDADQVVVVRVIDEIRVVVLQISSEVDLHQ